MTVVHDAMVNKGRDNVLVKDFKMWSIFAQFYDIRFKNTVLFLRFNSATGTKNILQYTCKRSQLDSPLSAVMGEFLFSTVLKNCSLQK